MPRERRDHQRRSAIKEEPERLRQHWKSAVLKPGPELVRYKNMINIHTVAYRADINERLPFEQPSGPSLKSDCGSPDQPDGKKNCCRIANRVQQQRARVQKVSQNEREP